MEDVLLFEATRRRNRSEPQTTLSFFFNWLVVPIFGHTIEKNGLLPIKKG
jgi:hypothetical protein